MNAFPDIPINEVRQAARCFAVVEAFLELAHRQVSLIGGSIVTAVDQEEVPRISTLDCLSSGLKPHAFFMDLRRKSEIHY